MLERVWKCLKHVGKYLKICGKVCECMNLLEAVGNYWKMLETRLTIFLESIEKVRTYRDMLDKCRNMLGTADKLRFLLTM